VSEVMYLTRRAKGVGVRSADFCVKQGQIRQQAVGHAEERGSGNRQAAEMA
jgi:hypothetical protein